jgi:hypothetical protein
MLRLFCRFFAAFSHVFGPSRIETGLFPDACPRYRESHFRGVCPAKPGIETLLGFKNALYR